MMPELPSVEIFTQYVQDTSLHQRIAHVTVYDERILDGVTETALQDALTARSFRDTHRHGKYLFASTGDQWMALHFGMTGRPVYLTPGEKTPEHTRLLIGFANNSRLAYDCQRRLGRIALTTGTAAFVRRKNLGPDALSISWKQFRQRFRRKRGMLKPALMDQHTVAGIGNIYADEIVFQLGLHPKTTCDALAEKILRKMYDTMQDILQTAIDRNAEGTALPDHYLAPHRSEGERCPRCSAPLKRMRISGRSSYVCPCHQPTP